MTTMSLQISVQLFRHKSCCTEKSPTAATIAAVGDCRLQPVQIIRLYSEIHAADLTLPVPEDLEPALPHTVQTDQDQYSLQDRNCRSNPTLLYHSKQ